MAGTIFGEYSKDGYGYWGYVEMYKKMMLFTSREEYLEYISNRNVMQKEPYWKQQGSSFLHKPKEKGAKI